jgi:hypothetical protein
MCRNYWEYSDDDICDCEAEECVCNDCRAKEEEDSDNTVAYFNIAISKDNNLLVEGDFREGHDADMSKLVFLINAGALSDFVAEIVYDRCGEDGEQTNAILKESYRMIAEYLEKQESDEDNDDEPVIDPCTVFSPRNGNEEDEGED